MRQNILIFIGLFGVLAGCLFALQGAGLLPYPADSFMVGNRSWIWNGLIIAGLSAIVVAGARLAPTRAEEKARRQAEKDARRAEREGK